MERGPTPACRFLIPSPPPVGVRAVSDGAVPRLGPAGAVVLRSLHHQRRKQSRRHRICGPKTFPSLPIHDNLVPSPRITTCHLATQRNATQTSFPSPPPSSTTSTTALAAATAIVRLRNLPSRSVKSSRRRRPSAVNQLTIWRTCASDTCFLSFSNLIPYSRPSFRSHTQSSRPDRPSVYNNDHFNSPNIHLQDVFFRTP